MAHKDCYYSEKHKAHLLNLMKQGFVGIGSIYVTCIVNGKEFTEQITHGKIPLSNHFGDLILVASGEESQMNIEYIKN